MLTTTILQAIFPLQSFWPTVAVVLLLASVLVDLLISYGLEFVFDVAASAAGTFILHSRCFTISDKDSLLVIVDNFVKRIGNVGLQVFPISFLSTVDSNALGRFSSIGYVTTDCI